VSKLYVLLHKSAIRPILEAPHLGRQPKQGLYKKQIYSSVNRGAYGHIRVDFILFGK
jgi:hypothetical protein